MTGWSSIIRLDVSNQTTAQFHSLIIGGHCRAFAPTWTKLARDKQHLERLAAFHMAQVNCLAQGGGSMDRVELTVDLCNSNGIKFCMSPTAIRADLRPPDRTI